MKLPNKIAHYLRGNVDFDSFFILDIAIQDKENAVLLLAPRDITTDKFFCMQYKGRSYFYGSMEKYDGSLCEMPVPQPRRRRTAHKKIL